MFTTCVRSEIDNIKAWCAEHNLMINEEKTKYLFFGNSGPSAGINDVLPIEATELKVLAFTRIL